MHILLATTKDDQFVLHYEKNGEWCESTATFATKNALVAQFANSLKTLDIPLSAIKGLGLLPLLGRFTTTRLAVTMANTLSYALKIPVLKLSAICDVSEFASLVAATTVGSYVLPEYQAPPRLGQKTYAF